MIHQVGSDQLHPPLRSHHRLQPGPLALELLLPLRLLAFRHLLEVRVDLRLLVLAQLDLGQATFVEDAHRGLVLHGLLDVVDVDVLAEHRRRALVLRLNGRAREPDERRLR